MLCCYADVFQYENSTIYDYVHRCNLMTIASYLTAFAGKYTTINNTIEISYCIGVMSVNGHHFIEAEGPLQCSSCSKVIFQFCLGLHHRPLEKYTDMPTLI